MSLRIHGKVGGTYVSTSDFIGVDLLAALDRGSGAMPAIGMNREPLEHGFPARLVTPGLYGCVSATK